jgi:hypothetical protein
VQELTLEDINPHGLYANPIKPSAPSKVDIIFDTGASVTQLPAEYATSWRNLRSTCLQLSGAFANDTVHSDLQIGEFHAELELDDGEKVRIIIPEAVCVSSTASTSYLLCDIQFLLAGHTYHSDLRKPRLELKTGGEYTMDVIHAHKLIRVKPIPAHEPSNHRNIMIHLPTRYDPPFFHNHTVISKRPNLKTPSAIIWHRRLACACAEVMKRTARNVIGMTIQQDSWKSLDNCLPCDSCIMGKMRKTKRAIPQDYMTLKELTTRLITDDSPARYHGFAVSRTPATTKQCNQRNKLIAFDWAIVNKQYLPNKNNVFGVFYDTNIGLIHIECAQSTGQAGEVLEGYI